MTYDHEIMARLLFAHACEDREGHLARGARRMLDALNRSLIGLDGNTLGDPARDLRDAVNQSMDAACLAAGYSVDPATYERKALEYIYEHVRSATLPHESRIDVEAWAARRLAELEGRAA